MTKYLGKYFATKSTSALSTGKYLATTGTSALSTGKYFAKVQQTSKFLKTGTSIERKSKAMETNK